MKCKILRLQDERPVNEFLATGIRVSTKHVYVTNDGIPEVAIFYDTPEDDAAFKDRLLIDQHVQMERLLDIAREVSKDDRYTALKNNTQREIFLFARYNIPNSDAGKVAELLKPEMASVLGGE